MLAQTPLDLVRDELSEAFASLAATLDAPSLVSLPVPPALLAQPGSVGLPRVLRQATVAWRPPGETGIIAGFGREIELRGRRESPLQEAALAIREVAQLPRINRVTGPAQPSFFGGGRFVAGGTVHDPAWDGFGGWAFVLPRLLLAVRGDAVEASITLLLEPGASRGAIAARLAETPCEPALATTEHSGWPTEAAGRDWRATVATAIDEIEAGRYQKVVLARPADIQRDEDIDTGLVLERLASRYERCFLFKMVQGANTWLGATPELLCKVRGGSVSTVALAGSVPRGSDPAADDALAARLLGDAKERHEHALVVHALREGLAPFCSEIEVPAGPEILRVANIQHLRTPITGRLLHGEDAMTVVAALHPSPAVGGWPRAEAVAAIDRLEGMDRGWYAGPIGRVGLDGDGEFAVGLRSGLIRGSAARFYAGAGIVHGSDPEREFAETETKFRPLREAIDGV